MTNITKEDELSSDKERTLERMLRKLFAYASTPEGSAELESISTVYAELKNKISLRLQSTLTQDEERALAFIERCRKEGGRASVRAVAAHLGFKSSRTGAKVVNRLREHGVIS